MNSRSNRRLENPGSAAAADKLLQRLILGEIIISIGSEIRRGRRVKVVVVIGVRIVEGIDNGVRDSAVVEAVIADLVMAFVRGGAAELLAVGMGFAVRWEGVEAGQLLVLVVVVHGGW